MEIATETDTETETETETRERYLTAVQIPNQLKHFQN